MSYASLQQLNDRAGSEYIAQLADRAAPPAGAADPAVIARALADADAVIDGYIAGRYVLPLASVPPLLVDIATSIALYKLHVTTPDQKISDDYKDALKSLEKVSTGIIRLPVAGIEPAASGNAGVEVNDRERDFSPENLTGFI